MSLGSSGIRYEVRFAVFLNCLIIKLAHNNKEKPLSVEGTLFVSNPALRVQLLRKLWVHLTPKEMFGIMSPDRIQKLGLSLGEVRRQELSNIHTVERQLNELRRGYSELDSEGRIVKSANSAEVRDVAFSSIIEFSSESPGVAEKTPTLFEMLQNARQSSDLESLGRLLRLQKVYLLTERIILSMNPADLDKGTLDPRWFSRWRINVSEIPNGPMQQMWARILVKELIRPGTHSLRALDLLACMTLEDAEMLNKLMGLTLDDFVYRSAVQALHEQYDPEMLEKLEELGVIRGVFGKVYSKVLRSISDSRFHCVLCIGDKQLTLTSDADRTELSIPAYLLTNLGKEIISLFSAAAETTYLDLVVSDLHARGLKVAISDADHNEYGRKVS